MQREATEFKRGSDLGPSAMAHAAKSLTCQACGEHTEQDAAKDLGWQVRPPVCPDCLRWTPTDTGPFTIRPRGRFWSVYEDGELLCITVYRKGAAAVVARLSRGTPGNGHGKA